MRVLIVHHEAEYFAGAEKMLGYFLEGLSAAGSAVTVAAVKESRVPEVIPAGVKTCWLPANRRFSPRQFWRQTRTLQQLLRAEPHDVVHAWAARDWELAGLAARLGRRPAVGTLHDHPAASFISKPRQKLMHWSARLGLRKVICVSEAVRQACLSHDYKLGRLAVIRNGLPTSGPARVERCPGPFRLGFLGLFSERKGLRGLFAVLEALSRITDASWEVALGGDAQDEEGRRLIQELKAHYSNRPWWPKIQWCGWVKRPREFLSSIDLLVCPSLEFDPFPTVLLEAADAGVPSLAARVGGVPEIVEDGMTGWLFAAGSWEEAALKLGHVLASPQLVWEAGLRAKKRVERDFAMTRMVHDYLSIYRELTDI